MRELIEQYELVKEIEYIFNGDFPKIKGKIFKIIKGVNAKYYWSINYYCRLETEASIYTPSAPFGDTLEIAEDKLFKYVKRFEKSVQWIESECF